MDEIRDPREEDKEVLENFFRVVIEDTIAREEIDIPYFLEDEVEDKMATLEGYLSREGERRVFLLACRRGKVVGTISYAPCNEALVDILGRDSEKAGEIGTVYVHPEYQKMGIGASLLGAICHHLLEMNIKRFYLDSGYSGAQRYWRKKLGEPMKVVKDYWDKGADHMIWYKEL